MRNPEADGHPSHAFHPQTPRPPGPAQGITEERILPHLPLPHRLMLILALQLRRDGWGAPPHSLPGEKVFLHHQVLSPRVLLCCKASNNGTRSFWKAERTSFFLLLFLLFCPLHLGTLEANPILPSSPTTMSSLVGSE